MQLPCPSCGVPVNLGKAEAGRQESWSHSCFQKNADDSEIYKQNFKKWKQNATRIHKENVRESSKRFLTQKTLWMAEIFAEEEKFYMPYTLDFRGRVYAQPHFNPQGHDLMKGLLEFGVEKPLGDWVGVDRLAIHGANLFGYDKVDLEGSQ